MRLLKWLIYTVAIIITAYILPGVAVSGVFAALVAGLILGLINTFIRPILLILTLPINVLSLGLFTLIINALLVLLASAIVPGFSITSFWSALLFGLVLAIVNAAIKAIIQDKTENFN